MKVAQGKCILLLLLLLFIIYYLNIINLIYFISRLHLLEGQVWASHL